MRKYKTRQNKTECNFFYYYLIWVLRPFQEYFTYIELIVHQRWAKAGEPGGGGGGENQLTIRKQNLAFPRVLSEARTTAVRNLMD